MIGRLVFAALVFAIAAGLAYAQQAVTVIGAITPGHCPQFFSTTQLSDSGVICGSAAPVGTVTSVSLALPGSVFSVSGSPVTGNGTLTGTFVNQNANAIFVGPQIGSPGIPTFRVMSDADLPANIVQSAPTSSYVNGVSVSTGLQFKQPAFAELSGVASATQLPIATNTTFGAVKTVSQTASNWVNGWIGGVAQLSQPNFSDITGSIASTQLPSAGNNTVLSNISGGTSTPQPNGVSAVFDAAFGAVQGAIIYRNNVQWVELAPGVNGQVLTTSGANNNPLWTTVSGTGTMTSIFPAPSIFLSTNPCSTSCVVSVASAANNTLLANTSGGSAPPVPISPSVLLDIFGNTQGNILYRGASVWTVLAPGTAGQFLQTPGPGSTPQWANPFANSGTATFQSGASELNPASTTSTTEVMMGVGSTCKLTPNFSSRIQITFYGTIENSAASATTAARMHFGTGAAPSNGQAVTGTQVGGRIIANTPAGGTFVPFTMTGIITGLTAGTAYWFDLGLLVSSGTGLVEFVSCSAMEF